jgi:tetratricopeptide (TPR) repeat protein
MKYSTTILIGICLSLAGAAPTTAPSPVSWTGRDTTGAEVRIPGAGVTVVAFVRVGQTQSLQSLDLMREALAKRTGVSTVLVVSGQQDKDPNTELAAKNPARWPLVVDTQFALSGQLDIHVWPTTLLIRKDGTIVAHLAGLPPAFADSFAASLDYASGAIGKAEYDERLASHEVVGDNDFRKARRHLEVATRLLDQGDAAGARTEVDAGLKLQPDDVLLKLALVRCQAAAGQVAEALAVINALPADALPSWQYAVVRADIYIKLQRWDDAQKLLPEAIRLNPSPAEAHYLSGLVYQHDGDAPKAADSFRKAYEAQRAR